MDKNKKEEMIKWRVYTEEEVNDLVRRNLKSIQAKKLKLRLRKYQIEAAMASYEGMASGRNVVLNLPTGTGKTMVANILSLMILENNPEKYCLYLAPSRSLAYQHHSYTKWLAPNYFSFLLLDECKSAEKIFTLSLRSKIIISTPELCANLIRSCLLPKEVVENFCMVSIDEFDDHFVFGFSDGGPFARLDSHFQKLYDCLPKSVRVQLVSATDPKLLLRTGNEDPIVSAYSLLMDNLYNPMVIDVDRKHYSRYIPTACIQSIVVYDEDVYYLAWAISVEMAVIFDNIYEETGFLLDRDDVLLKLESIINKNVLIVKQLNGRMVSVKKIDIKYFYKLRNLLNCHEHLYEDMFDGFEYEIKMTKIFSMRKLEFVYILLPRLIDNRDSNTFNVNLRFKANTLTDILTRNKGQSGVIFTRKIRLSDSISKEVAKYGWNSIQVDSGFTDKERDKRLNCFREGKYDLLIITRRTGRRGLDLPEANFAVFYSPKERETTTWQELSRIRSNMHTTKISYIMSYGDTADLRRMNTLEKSMRKSGREYRINDKIFFGKRDINSDYVQFLKDAKINVDLI